MTRALRLYHTRQVNLACLVFTGSAVAGTNDGAWRSFGSHRQEGDKYLTPFTGKCFVTNYSRPRAGGGAVPPISSKLSPMTGGDPKMTGSDPPMTGSDPLMTGSDTLMTGSDPLMTGSDPLMTGSDPLMTSFLMVTSFLS